MKQFAWLSCGGAPLRTAVTARAAPPSQDTATEWADRQAAAAPEPKPATIEPKQTPLILDLVTTNCAATSKKLLGAARAT
jgi:hypothetical protein